MKPLLFLICLMFNLHANGQTAWSNLPEENQAEEATKNGDYQLAIQMYELALEKRIAKYPDGIYRKINSLNEVSKAAHNLRSIYTKAGDKEKYLDICMKLTAWAEAGIAIFPTKKSPFINYYVGQITMAEGYRVLGELDKGLRNCEKVIESLLKPEDHNMLDYEASSILAYAQSTAGKILKKQDKILASAQQHQNSIVSWQKSFEEDKDHSTLEAIVDESLICIQRFDTLNDTINVIRYAALAIQNYETLSDLNPSNQEYKEGIVNVSNTIAKLKLAQGENEAAIELYKRSLADNEKQFKISGNADYLTQMAALNLKISNSYSKLGNTGKSAEHHSFRIEQLKQLQELIPSTDYSYSISRNQYELAKKYENLDQLKLALATLDESIALCPIMILKDPENHRKKEWQWVLEFFRYDLLLQLENYKLAYGSLDHLKDIFNSLEVLEPGINYYEHLKEVEVSQRELAYPEIVKLSAETKALEAGKIKFEKSIALVKLLKKKKRKDHSMRLPYVKHSSELAWTGLMCGEYKKSKKVLRKAMRIKPVDPYLITNYAPCLLFLGNYKRAEKIYFKYYDDPFKPGKKIIDGYLDDFKVFEEKGVIPDQHREKLEEIKVKLEALITK